MDMPLNVIVKSFRQNPEGFEVTEPRNLGSSKYSVIGVTDKDTETNLHPYQNVTYFVINRDTRRAAVIDPGIIGGVGVEKQRGYLAMSKLGIEQALYGVITHCHIDHWIGFKSYPDIPFYATQACIDTLNHGGEAVQFARGTLAPSHSTDLPPRVIEYAKSLKWDHQLTNYKNMLRGHQEDIPMDLLALPGQTRDSSYAVMESDGEKYLFAGDLFLDGGEKGLLIEPHYSQVDKLSVVQDTLIVLNGILGKGQEIPESYGGLYPDIYQTLTTIQNPDLIFLGHNTFDMSENRAAVEELAHGLKDILRHGQIKERHRKYMVCGLD